MKPTRITAERARELFAYERETGHLIRKSNRLVAGSFNKEGYIQIKADGRNYLAHRLIWLIVHGRWPNLLIDHLNCDRADNRLTNLREASFAVNSQNVRSANPHNKSSGLLGATRVGIKWQAQIKYQGATRYIGLYSSAQEAHAAYVAAKRELHEGCTL